MSRPGGTECMALISRLTLKSFWTIPRFLIFGRQVEKQLADAKGLVGYSLQAEFSARRFWTLSVWRNEAALMDFVYALPHNRVMESLANHTSETGFMRWQIGSDQLPPDWVKAKEKFSKK
jgi:hypothetical protein